jgi:hypothetical protein
MSYILLKDFIGRDRGWKVNMMTVELWSKQLDDAAFQSSSLYGAVYAGLIANCKVKQEEPDFTFEQVCEVVDEMNLTEAGQLTLDEIRVKFEESQYYIVLVKKLQDKVEEIENVKKKETEMIAP